ncbi:MAG TPA: hypothetical protein VFE33_03290 [Thermoanaerobaculia bacterium]|nr:hypothetical protein [Thermoanaerobaculia bacterium]
MKKVLVHLSMLCLLAFLLAPLSGCKKEENTEVEEQPAASTEAPAASTEAPAMGTGSTMGTEGAGAMGTEGAAPTGGAMGTQGTEPPPAK